MNRRLSLFFLVVLVSATSLLSQDQHRLELPDGDGKAALEAALQGISRVPFTSSRVFPLGTAYKYPYSAVGKIFVEWPDGTFSHCTGTMIAPRILLTAGHCVHNGRDGAEGYFSSFFFAPSYLGGEPAGFWEGNGAVVHPAWLTGGGRLPNAGDYALVRLADNEVGRAGSTTGWLPFAIHRLFPNHVTMLGYPSAFDEGEFLHMVTSQSFKRGPRNTVLYGSDMTDGADGGPWIESFGQVAAGQQIEGAANQVVGLTSYTYRDPQGAQLAGSPVLDEDFHVLFRLICLGDTGNCIP